MKVFPHFLESFLNHFLFDQLATKFKIFSACKICNFCYFIFFQRNLEAVGIKSRMTSCGINVVLKIFC